MVGLVVGLLVGAEFMVRLGFGFVVWVLVCSVFGGLFLFVGGSLVVSSGLESARIL